MPKETTKPKKRRDAIARTARWPVSRRRDDTERLTELEDWLIGGKEEDELLTIVFDAKTKRIWVGTDCGKDLRSALDSFLQRQEDAHYFLTHASGEEMQRVFTPVVNEIKSNRKKRTDKFRSRWAK